MSTTQPHSAEYFGEQRDYWWNADFVAMVFGRWGLGACVDVLDVGCGVGHWGRVLLPHLPANARLFGVDREAAWVEQATTRARSAGLGERTSYAQGDAERLPFPDAMFDLVTCQTVLIHVRDPRAVVREMVRVLKPGGAVLVAEPNNMANASVVSNLRFDEAIETRIALARFQLVCERGKEARGEGNNSIGDLVPGIFAQSGLKSVDACLSDRATLMLPPYTAPDQAALRAQLLDWCDREFWIWDRSETLRYFLAGGGTESEFSGLWELAMGVQRRECDALRRGELSTAGGGVSYLVVGRKE